MSDNEIIKYFNNGIKDIPIRKRNKIYIDIHYKDYERLLIHSMQYNLSLSALIRLMTSPCQKCGHDKIEIMLINIQPSTCHQGNHIFNKKTDS
jgi:hypothetical protein